MENIQGKVDLEKPTQEQIKPIFVLWSHIICGPEDFNMRIKMTRAYLREFNCESIWDFKFDSKELIGSKSIDNKELGSLVLEKLFTFIYNPKFVNSTVQTNEVFELLKEKEFKINALSQEGRECLETNIINTLSNFPNAVNEEKAKREKQLINFIETVGLFKDLTEKRTLDFAKNVVTSNSTHLLEWLFSLSRGLSPDTMIEQNNDQWPLASLSPTMDMLNVFVSHGANLALTSKNGVAFSKLLSKRTKSFYPFTTLKDRDQIVSTVYKAEIAIQTNPQEYLWKLIDEATRVNDAVTAIRSYKGACDLRDQSGRHILQFAMVYKPTLVTAILSINKKTLALGSTPDKHGRLPSVYWVANGELQNIIKETNRTSVIIPTRINKEIWRQAAELAYELELGSIGLCSTKVQKKFKRTTRRKLDEWIEEEEAANGNPWFERMVDIAIKRKKKALHNVNFLSSDAINRWADTDNRCVINEAHALFRAHLMFTSLTRYIVPINFNIPQTKKILRRIKRFFQTHLVGDVFDTLKNQINDGVSFLNHNNHLSLVESQWWKETCIAMEKLGLLKKHAEILNTTTHNKFDAL